MGARILVVEDDPLTRRALVSLLRSTYYDVAEARDGVEGLAAAVRLHPQVVVADVTMPAMGGLELVRLLRADARTARLPVVLLTAHSAASELAAGLRAGGAFYLRKPVDADLLASTVEFLLRTHPNP